MSGMTESVGDLPLVSAHYYPASSEVTTDLVLVHGWGGNARAWVGLLPELRDIAAVTVLEYAGNAFDRELASSADVDDLCAALISKAPRGALWLGWSLGGLLAVRAASEHPEHIAGVITLGSNPRFLAGDAWPGMQAETFTQFVAGLSQNPNNTLKRFAALQFHGGSKQALKQWREQTGEQPDAVALAQGLRYLAELDVRAALAELKMPVLCLFAEQDALVPVDAGRTLEDSWAGNSNRQVRFVAGSHGFCWEHPKALAREIGLFIDKYQPKPETAKSTINKRDVARSFSQAADSYDAVATLQRQVGKTLLQQRPRQAHHILDLGCGTGYFSARLRKHYPRAQVIGLDLAQGMVRYAKAQHGEHIKDWLTGDAEQLPLADNSVDLIYSSLVVQWCQQPKKLWAELARVLKPGGEILCSTLGPDTLKELRSAWAAVDDAVHVNRFASVFALTSTMPNSLKVSYKTETIVLRYGFLMGLLKELKSLGAHNVNRGRKRGMTGKRQLQALINAYESFREHGELPATYDVIYLHLVKDAASCGS